MLEQERLYQEQSNILESLAGKSQEHRQLSDGIYEERILAMASEPLSTFSQVFGVLKNVDLSARLPEAPSDDGSVDQLTHASFITRLESRNREVRRQAFEGYYREFKGNRNTIVTTMSGAVKTHVFNARVRNFGSAIEASLFDDHVEVAVDEDRGCARPPVPRAEDLRVLRGPVPGGLLQPVALLTHFLLVCLVPDAAQVDAHIAHRAQDGRAGQHRAHQGIGIGVQIAPGDRRHRQFQHRMGVLCGAEGHGAGLLKACLHRLLPGFDLFLRAFGKPQGLHVAVKGEAVPLDIFQQPQPEGLRLLVD